MPAIRISKLKKCYENGVQALKGIDMTIEEGCFFGLLGPNGAGKSTLISILTDLVTKDEGEISINGYDFDSQTFLAKQQLGVVPQEFNCSVFEPCLQILVNQAGYYGMTKSEALPKAKQLLQDLGLGDKMYTMSRRLSGGQKRRLMIARALVHSPKILILDEPTAGVDVHLRHFMWEFLKKLNKEGCTIILTTHYLEEAEALCENIAFINHGEIIESMRKDELLKTLPQETLILQCGPYNEVPQLPNYLIKEQSPNVLEVGLKASQKVTELIEALKVQGVVVERLEPVSSRLEELFKHRVKL